MAGIASVTGWLLKQSPDIVEKLDRRGDVVRIKNALELGLEGVELLAPQEIDVYQVKGKVRFGKLFFFTARADNDTTPAYCSCVSTLGTHLHRDEKARIILLNPWYSSPDSSKIFHRLGVSSKKLRVYLADCTRQEGRHPFLRG